MKQIIYSRRGYHGWRRYRVRLPNEGARQFCRDARKSRDFKILRVRDCV